MVEGLRNRRQKKKADETMGYNEGGRYTFTLNVAFKLISDIR